MGNKGWQKKCLSDITEIVGGGTPKTNVSAYWNGDIVWLSPTDLPPIGEIVYISSSKNKITELGLKQSSSRLLPKGTVVFSSRASIGKIGIAEVELCTNQGFANFICHQYVYNKFLAYALKRYTPEIASLSNSTTFAEVSKSRLKEFTIPLPPLPEQHRIVAKLDRLFERIDKAIVLVEQNITNAQHLLASVLNEVFDDLILKYGTVVFPEVFSKITDGSHFSPKTVDIGIPYITVRDIDDNGNINIQTSKRITDNDYKQLVKAGCKPNTNDLLFSKDGTVGKVALVNDEQEFVVLSSLAILTPDLKKLNPEFVYFYLKSPQIQSEAIGLKTGAAIKRVVLKTIKTLTIPVPELSTQRSVVENLKSFRKQHNVLVTKQSSRLAELKALKSSLLDAAFKGGVVILF